MVQTKPMHQANFSVIRWHWVDLNWISKSKQRGSSKKKLSFITFQRENVSSKTKTKKDWRILTLSQKMCQVHRKLRQAWVCLKQFWYSYNDKAILKSSHLFCKNISSSYFFLTFNSFNQIYLNQSPNNLTPNSFWI